MPLRSTSRRSAKIDIESPLIVISGALPSPLSPLFFTDASGAMHVPLQAPPSLAGLTLGLQAAVADPLTGLKITNAVEVSIGN